MGICCSRPEATVQVSEDVAPPLEWIREAEKPSNQQFDGLYDIGKIYKGSGLEKEYWNSMLGGH